MIQKTYKAVMNNLVWFLNNLSDFWSLIFEQFGINSSQKTRIEQLSNPLLSLEMKKAVQLTIFTFFSAKLTKNWSKILKMWIKTTIIHKTLNLDNSL